MREKLRTIIPEAINYYIEKNLDEFYIKSSKHSNFTSNFDEKVSWVRAQNSDWPDCIFKASFDKKTIKNEIKNIRTLIRKGKAPNGWTIGPLTKPQNLGSQLEKFGFSNVYHQVGMAVKLDKLKRGQNIENDLMIEKVVDEKSLIQWSGVVSKVFDLSIDIEHLKFIQLQKEAHFYLGKFNKLPVSTLLLYLSSGVAGLHAVSTLPNYRNQGFGLTISRTALIDAYNMGYYVGVLQASSLGERVYRKLGFQKYCDIISYALPKDTKFKKSY
ncbi:MAG: GNAT family N-acetyltransferase [Promethearchaeota archaeon]